MDRKNNFLFVSVPFEKKNIAKEMGCFWCPDNKLWYVPRMTFEYKREQILDIFGTARESTVDLNVHYSDREIAKQHGAKWDKERRTWYLPRTCTRENYEFCKKSKWLPRTKKTQKDV